MSSKRRIKRAERRKECGDKIRYESLDAANRACSDIRRKERKHVSGYKCPHCPYYHWGHTPARILQSIRDKVKAQQPRPDAKR